MGFWQGKKVLITGHTGFKGGWLTLWLKSLGAEVCGIALEPNTQPNLFTLADVSEGIDHHIQDIRVAGKLTGIIKSFDPEIVFHMAAQPLVRASYDDPLGNFDTNVMGTANVLNALRDCPSVKTIVVITTDKVYENHETGHAYKESDHLGGHDPYSASKACTEIVTQSYRKSFFAKRGVNIATARAGNVIGGGDWAADRLIPDAIKAWQAGETLEIRSPQAVRPWQHVLDPLHAYITLAKKMTHSDSYNEAWNFGPEQTSAVPVRTVIDLAHNAYDGGKVHYHDSHDGPHEAGLLMLDIEKARARLGIAPRWDLETAVTRTMQWYIAIANGGDARDLCMQDIEEFTNG